MRTFKDILSVPQLFIFKLNHKYNLPLHLIIYNNDSVDVLPITSRCISDQVTKFPIRSRHDVSPIKSRSVPTKYVRSHDVFRTTYEMSDLIRIRIGSEGATDSSSMAIYNKLEIISVTGKENKIIVTRLSTVYYWNKKNLQWLYITKIKTMINGYMWLTVLESI